MFIVKNRLAFDDDFKVRVVAINIESFMGLGVFACKDGSCFVTAVERRGEHEKLVKCSSLEEAEALVDDILSAMRSGASVYDCNAWSISPQVKSDYEKVLTEPPAIIGVDLALKKFRQKSGIKQFELADILGVAKSTISMWETGERKPDIVTLKKLAELFQCTTDDLLEPIET